MESREQTDEDYFNQLPDELLLAIYAYLGVLDIVALSMMSQRHRWLTDDVSLWEALWRRHFFEKRWPRVSHSDTNWVKSTFIKIASYEQHPGIEDTDVDADSEDDFFDFKADISDGDESDAEENDSDIQNLKENNPVIKKPLPVYLVRLLLSITPYTPLKAFQDSLEKLKKAEQEDCFQSRQSPFHDVLLTAISQDNVPIAEYLLTDSDYAENWDRNDDAFYSPLTFAMQQGSPKMVQFLLKKGEKFTQVAVRNILSPRTEDYFPGISQFNFNKNMTPVYQYFFSVIKENAVLKKWCYRFVLQHNHLEAFEMLCKEWFFAPTFMEVWNEIENLRAQIYEQGGVWHFPCDRILNSALVLTKENMPLEIPTIPAVLFSSILIHMIERSDSHEPSALPRLFFPSESFYGYVALLQLLLTIKNIDDIDQIRDSHQNTLLHYLCWLCDAHLKVGVDQIEKVLNDRSTTSLFFMSQDNMVPLICRLIYMLMQYHASISAQNDEGKRPGDDMPLLKNLLEEMADYVATKSDNAGEVEDPFFDFDFLDFKAWRIKVKFPDATNTLKPPAFSSRIYTPGFPVFFSRTHQGWKSVPRPLQHQDTSQVVPDAACLFLA